MKDSLKKEVIEILNCLKSDAKMALEGKWDCTTKEGIETGFSAQVKLINELLEKLENGNK